MTGFNISGDVVASPVIGCTTIVLLSVTAAGALMVLGVMAYIRKRQKGQTPPK